jgi:hypothetical protein
VSAVRAPEDWTREEAIARLREGLLRLSDGEHSMCRVAAELGIFCRGFQRWPDGVFQRSWSKVLGRSTHLDRSQLEEFADLWQLTEQLRLRVPIACDAQAIIGGTCRGWNEFSNADLARFSDEILGRSVVITESGGGESPKSLPAQKGNRHRLGIEG